MHLSLLDFRLLSYYLTCKHWLKVSIYAEWQYLKNHVLQHVLATPYEGVVVLNTPVTSEVAKIWSATCKHFQPISSTQNTSTP